MALTAGDRGGWAPARRRGPIARLTGQVERCTDVVGTFPGEAAVVRPADAITLKQSDEAATRRARDNDAEDHRRGERHFRRRPVGRADPARRGTPLLNTGRVQARTVAAGALAAGINAAA